MSASRGLFFFRGKGLIEFGVTFVMDADLVRRACEHKISTAQSELVEEFAAIFTRSFPTHLLGENFGWDNFHRIDLDHLLDTP